MNLTAQDFSRNLNSAFQLQLHDRTLELKLVEVKAYVSRDTEQAGMERFSIYFEGPPDHLLVQKLYHFEHSDIGGIDIFLVPVDGNEKGFRYEAVFNYFKSEPPAVASG